jgi:hypothetical protein
MIMIIIKNWYSTRNSLRSPKLGTDMNASRRQINGVHKKKTKENVLLSWTLLEGADGTAWLRGPDGV